MILVGLVDYVRVRRTKIWGKSLNVLEELVSLFVYESIQSQQYTIFVWICVLLTLVGEYKGQI